MWRILAIYFALSALAPCSSLAETSEEEQIAISSFQVTTDLVCTIDRSKYNCYIGQVSADAQEAAFIISSKKKQYVMFRQEKGREYDKILNVTLSPDGNRLGYTARKKDMLYVIVDNKEFGKYLDIGDTLTFSADSRRFVFTAWKKRLLLPKPVAVVDGKEHGYDNILGELSELFSPDGTRLAYGIRDGDDARMMIDGVAGRKYDETADGPHFSPDGKHISYVGLRNDTAYVVIDENEYGGYTSAGKFVFAPEGDQFAYMAIINYDTYVVLNHERSAAYNKVWDLIFSPDGERFSYLAQHEDGGNIFPVIDGIELESYDDLSAVLFNSDGSRYSYIAQYLAEDGSESQTVIVDGVPQQPSGVSAIRELTFSGDGMQIVFIAVIDTNQTVVVIDSLVSDQYLDATNPCFSTDGSRVAYRAKLGFNQWCMVCDGIQGPEFEGLGLPVFSSDSEHLSYVGWRNNLLQLVIDDSVMQAYWNMNPYLPVFDELNRITYFARNIPDSIFKVVVEPSNLTESE